MQMQESVRKILKENGGLWPTDKICLKLAEEVGERITIGWHPAVDAGKQFPRT